MFVKFPVTPSSETRVTEKAIEIDDIREMHSLADRITLFLLDDHDGGLLHFGVRLSLDEAVRKVNHAKLYAASFVANDVAAAQGVAK